MALLKQIRQDYDWKQYEVANKLGVKRSTYSLWESEKEQMPLKRINQFCNLFNVSIDYLFELNYSLYYENSHENMNLKISAQRLKEIRREHHHTQEYIASKFNLDRSLISKYEKGELLISTTFLIEYAKLYHISCDYLVGKIDERIELGKTYMIS